MAVADSRTGVGDDAVLTATGKHPDDWFRLLDERNATSWRHADIAAWLVRDQGVDPWWSQSLTVRYEQQRGMRSPGQMADGTYSVSASRTLPGDKRQLLDSAVEVVGSSVGKPPASVRPAARYATARWKARRRRAARHRQPSEERQGDRQPDPFEAPGSEPPRGREEYPGLAA
ncbi:MAG: DUF4287 domain-containing protein [Actinomycetota bacterium]|nr:DUF4287 domain-containing protein [Actinomycetota bacterium]